jgi:NADH:ubiquinone oxidoreductase subunit 4 (subunit M)
MDFYREHLLSVITYTPLVGALLLLLPVFGGKGRENAVRWAANAVALLGFLLSLPLWFWFDRSASSTSSGWTESPRCSSS